MDGWGVAFFEGKGLRNFCDSLPSALSPVANLICTYPIKTRTVIAHVRMATQGKVGLENVHPFSRELWGRCVSTFFLPTFVPLSMYLSLFVYFSLFSFSVYISICLSRFVFLSPYLYLSLSLLVSLSGVVRGVQV